MIAVIVKARTITDTGAGIATALIRPGYRALVAFFLLQLSGSCL